MVKRKTSTVLISVKRTGERGHDRAIDELGGRCLTQTDLRLWSEMQRWLNSATTEGLLDKAQVRSESFDFVRAQMAHHHRHRGPRA